jgi:hypothetical protein
LTEEFTKPTEIASNLTNWKKGCSGNEGPVSGAQYYQQKIKKVSNQVDVLRKSAGKLGEAHGYERILFYWWKASSVCKKRCSQICKEQAMFFPLYLEVPCQAEYLLGIMSCGRLLMLCKV